MRRLFLTALAAAGLAGGSWLGVRGAGQVPPLAPLLDPVNGAWGAARTELPTNAEARIPNLSAPVDVRYDRRGVPHIFAATEADAIRALGYVVARDRLFQLEVQARAASGRLTEWAGSVALPADQEMRRLGLPASAEAHRASLPAGDRRRAMLDAYAEGVNAWIDALRPADWPIEYRLLGARPARWSPVNTMHLFARMGWTLAFGSSERSRVAVAALVGDTAAEALFPPHTPIVEPIQPNGEGRPRYDFRPIPPPGSPSAVANHVTAFLPRALPDDGEPRPSFASNNWAVAPRRTAAGKALLAGDPHLDMSLPSLWYEVHLVVPGTLDVYGVTIPGAPGIIIGFTRDVAWSFTNTGADVLDLYAEMVDDPRDPRKYQLDGAWMPLALRIETYRGKHGEELAVDTLRFTHRGPLSRSTDGRWVSMRWTVLAAELNQTVFLDAARATTARDFLDIMADGFGAPAQNMIVADRRGTIAIRSTGRFPIRPAGTNGFVIQDGSRSANDWQGYWPLERYPQSFDPPQGFLASANQEPLDPRRSEYLGLDNDFDPWRALRINRLLRSDSAVTPETMRLWQTDPGSERAEAFVPWFVHAADAARARGRSTPALDSAASWLAAWDRRYVPGDDHAVLFEAAMRQLVSRTWDELTPDGGRRVATPSSAVLLGLLRDSASVWWDDHRTSDVVEGRDAILAASLVAAHDSLVRRFGDRAAGGWRWGAVGATRIMHLLGIPAFSERGIAVQGGPGTLNPASTGGHGPSWRMVVELGDSVRAWGTYPGGQSGNPISARYRDRIPLWRQGALDTLFAPRDTASLAPSSRLRIVPGVARRP
ncbi:MAG TPA: penicillin acylase family protein [Gemmatimonadaceae bacterium]